MLHELRELNIAGLDGDWPDDLDQFNTAEMVALSQARSLRQTSSRSPWTGSSP